MPPDIKPPPIVDAYGRTLVRTTIEPHREIWVTDAERVDLHRNGLLLDSSAPRPEDAGAAPARKRTTTAGAKAAASAGEGQP
jgi:hypothetical protein